MTFDPKTMITSLKGAVGDYFSTVVAGPPGTGKSTLAGTMAKYIMDTYKKKTLLIATMAREEKSWKYQELGEQYLDRILVTDDDWRPDLKIKMGNEAFKATGFFKTLELLDWLNDDDKYGGVILDNGTEHAEQAWHASLAPFFVASPADIDGRSRWLPYERLDSMLDQSVKSLVSLTTAKHPKFVFITWHIQAPKDDQVETVGDKSNAVKIEKKSSDNTAKGLEYEGEVLPMIRGRFRRRLAGQVDAMLYTEVENKQAFVNGSIQAQTRYLVQVRPNPERHTKLPGPMPSVPYIENDFTTLIKVLRSEYTPVVKETPEVNLTFSTKKSK